MDRRKQPLRRAVVETPLLDGQSMETLPGECCYAGDGTFIGWFAGEEPVPMATDERIVRALDELNALKGYMAVEEDGDTCMVLSEDKQGMDGAVAMNDHAVMMYACKAMGELYQAVVEMTRRIEHGGAGAFGGGVPEGAEDCLREERLRGEGEHAERDNREERAVETDGRGGQAQQGRGERPGREGAEGQGRHAHGR